MEGASCYGDIIIAAAETYIFTAISAAVSGAKLTVHLTSPQE